MTGPSSHFNSAEREIIAALNKIPVLDGDTGTINLHLADKITSRQLIAAIKIWQENDLPVRVQERALLLNADRNPEALASLISAIEIQRKTLRTIEVTYPGGSTGCGCVLGLAHDWLKVFGSLVSGIESFQARMQDKISKLPDQEQRELLNSFLRNPTRSDEVQSALTQSTKDTQQARNLLELIEHNFLIVADRCSRDRWRYNPIELLDSNGNPRFLMEYSSRIVEIQVPTDRGVLTPSDVFEIGDLFRLKLLATSYNDEDQIIINSAGVFEQMFETEAGRAAILLIREPTKLEVVDLSLPEGAIAGVVDFNSLQGRLEFHISNTVLTIHQSPFEDCGRLKTFVDNLKAWVVNDLESRSDFEASRDRSTESEKVVAFIELAQDYYPQLDRVIREGTFVSSELYPGRDLSTLLQAQFIIGELERYREYLAIMTDEDLNTIAEWLSDFSQLESDLPFGMLVLSIKQWPALCELPTQISPNVDYDIGMLESELKENCCFIRLSSSIEYHALLSRLNPQGRDTFSTLVRERMIAADVIRPEVLEFLNSASTDDVRSAIQTLIENKISEETLPSELESMGFMFLCNLQGYNDHSWTTAKPLPFSSHLWRGLINSHS